MQTQGLTKAIREFLSDGEWHEVGEITSVVRHGIPPEVATRAYLYSHKKQKPGKHGPTWMLHKGYDIVGRKAIRGLVRIGAVEVRREWALDGKGKILAVKLAEPD